MCGENGTQLDHQSDQLGSSPRMRGKRHLIPEINRVVGLIPACAGKTVPTLIGRIQNAAHPRVCGENRLAGGPATLPTGSSPRVRGKR